MAWLGTILTKEKRPLRPVQVVFSCQQNLCQQGETCWILERGRIGGSRKAGMRAKLHFRFCVYPSGAGTWCRNKKGYWKIPDLLSFLPSKHHFSPLRDFILSSKALLCSIAWTAPELLYGWCFSHRALPVLHLFLLVKQCFPLPQLILCCRYKIHCLEEDLLD